MDNETDDREFSDEPVEGAATQANWPSSEKHRLLRLESVLFLAREPLNSRKLSELAGLEDGTQARTLVKKLNGHYDRVGRSFHAKMVAGGYQLMTRPQFAPWLRRLEFGPKAVRLSSPMMETLAVVAYRQPVLKAEIEAIRGVGCGELLRQLMEGNLVRISGRSPELGNPYLYSTSKRFLESFGLGSLDVLPRAATLQGQGIPDWSNEEQTTETVPIDPSDKHSSEATVTNEECET